LNQALRATGPIKENFLPMHSRGNLKYILVPGHSLNFYTRNGIRIDDLQLMNKEG
jgi:hypothetical protein